MVETIKGGRSVYRRDSPAKGHAGDRGRACAASEKYFLAMAEVSARMTRQELHRH